LGGWLGCLPKFVNKSYEVAVLRRDGSEPLRIDKRGCNISVGAVECNQRGTDATIVSARRNMAEKEEFVRLLHDWRSACVLIATFGLTVIED
jgi:hypothetical protein